MVRLKPGLSIQEAEFISELEDNSDPKIKNLLKIIERLRSDDEDRRSKNPRYDIEDQCYYVFSKSLPTKIPIEEMEFDFEFRKSRIGDSTEGKFYDCIAYSEYRNSSFQVRLEPRIRDFDEDTGEFFDEDRFDESEVGFLMNFDVTENGPTVELHPTGDNAKFVLEIKNKTLTIRVASSESESSQNTYEQEI